jgi:hypothetical protein
MTTTTKPSPIHTEEIRATAVLLRDLRVCAKAQAEQGDLVSFAQINAEVIKTERLLAQVISAEIAKQARRKK